MRKFVETFWHFEKFAATAASLQTNTASISTYLGLGATSASDSRGQRAGPTAAFMAQLLTQMD